MQMRAGMANMKYDQRVDTKMDMPFEVKRLTDDGQFEGMASVFGVLDQMDDVVAPDAFADTLKERKVRILWQHDVREVIGTPLEIMETEEGLFLRAQLVMDTQRARETHALLKAGAIDALSIGFRVREFEINEDTGIRTLKKVDLFEVSVVTFPALEVARITDVRSADAMKTIGDFERFLRDAGGFSRADAKRIASRGFKNTPRDARVDHGGLAVTVERFKQLAEM